jgi:perosamine synthetase
MIPIARPFLDVKEAKAAHDAVLSGWVTQGPKVMEFEQVFSKYTGAAFSCAVSNCTVALHMALLAVAVSPGDVVITVSHSFIATANSIRYCGAEPVFVDIDEKTYNMDTVELERFLNEDCIERNGHLFYRHVDRLALGTAPLALFNKEHSGSSPDVGRVSAVMAVHQMGRPCDIVKIVSVAGRYGIKVVEDAACAVGSAIKSGKENSTWEMIGRPYGDIACFSFHPRKIITTGEGGMVTTNNVEYDSKFRLLRQHGMTVSDSVRHSSNDIVFEEYALTGFNYRMTDIQAAIGLEQMKKLDGIIAERIKLAGLYRDALNGLPHISIPDLPDSVISNWQSYPVRISDSARFTQREFMRALLDSGISSRRGIMNAHQEHPYKEQNWQLPVSEKIRDSVVLIPFFNGMTDEQTDHVLSAIKRICRD